MPKPAQTPSPIRIAINGFGRIGRTVLRAACAGDWPQIEIVQINDVAPLDVCAYLFRYDSVFGPFQGQVEVQDNHLMVNGKAIRFTNESDPAALDLDRVDVLMDCTGRAKDRAFAQAGLAGGAARVLISGPCIEADATIVIGANEDKLRPDHKIVSNASCTTNATAPLIHALDRAYGVETALMTTIHCYTGSQPTVDMPMQDRARSRAAALSMVPTTTSAEALIDVVLPHLAGRVTGSAVRVPVASVSAIDLAVITRALPQVAQVQDLLRTHGGVIGYEDEALVSSDLRGRAQSLIIAGPQTKRAKGGMLRVFGWYDNEWGFSARMLDMACLMAAQDRQG